MPSCMRSSHHAAVKLTCLLCALQGFVPGFAGMLKQTTCRHSHCPACCSAEVCDFAGMPLALPAWLLPPYPISKTTRKPKEPKPRQASKKQKQAGDTDALVDYSAQQQEDSAADAHVHLQIGSQQHQTWQLAHGTAEPAGMPTQQEYPGRYIKTLSKAKRAKHHAQSQPSTAYTRLGHLPSPPRSNTAAAAGSLDEQNVTLAPRQLFSDLSKPQLAQDGVERPSFSQPHAPKKRKQTYEIIRASQRCGHCKTCLNSSMKKACLTRRAEMEATNAAPLDA